MQIKITKPEINGKFFLRIMIAVVLLIFFFLSIEGLITCIQRRNNEIIYVQMLDENVPIDDIFELGKDSLELLRNGEFSKQGLSTRGANLVADYKGGDIPFDDWPFTASLPEAEIKALDYLCNYLGLDVSCGRDGFKAEIYIDYGIITIQYTQVPPSYPEPFIVKNLGDGYYATIFTWNYYSSGQNESIASWIVMLVLSGGLLILYIILLFLKPRKPSP